VEEEGDRLFGLVEFKDEKIASDVRDGKITGGSALINLNHSDHESGEEHGPTLIHWALTNAPYIKGLAPYEEVALGEEEGATTFIALNDEEGGSVNPIEQALEALKDASDEDIRKALADSRPGVLDSGDEGGDEPTAEQLAEAKEEGRKEVMAALSEKGIEVVIDEGAKGDETKVDVSKSPEFVKLSEEFETFRKERDQEKAESVVDKAIEDGKVLPSQKEALVEVALSEGGMDRLAKLIPEKAIVDLKERGVDPSKETVELSEEDIDGEADRYLAYLSTGEKKEG
jgi:phage I-like protein